jgi:ABC-2 type transport system ATP-binding protein
MDDLSALVVDRVTKRFDEFTAVEDLSLTAQQGRIFGLIGPNGAGKTTTIRMIVQITRPDTGSIRFLGRPLDERALERIGYLPEERGLYKKMKVGEQLRFFGELKGLSGREADARAARWLDRMKLSDRRNNRTDELSKGMQQKIQFIATVMHEPELLILDEPFSGLDPVNAELLKEIVLELKSANRTIIFCTHLMEQAEKICDDICLINRSHKVLDGSLRDVKKSFRRNAVALRAEGDFASLLEDKQLVANVKNNGDDVEILLAAGANAQELLRRLVATNAIISRFEQIEPSLHDIFITKVNETS